jgi:hypothetical protein
MTTRELVFYFIGTAAGAFCALLIRAFFYRKKP